MLPAGMPQRSLPTGGERFIHSFIKHVLSIHYEELTGLGPQVRAVNRRGSGLAELTVSMWGDRHEMNTMQINEGILLDIKPAVLRVTQQWSKGHRRGSWGYFHLGVRREPSQWVTSVLRPEW